MKRKSVSHGVPRTILRDVALHPEPHTLARPGRNPAKAVFGTDAPVAMAPLPVHADTTDVHTSSAVVEVLREQAVQAGRKEGQQQGFAEGMKSGQKQGYEEGFKQGKAAAEAEATEHLKRISSELESKATALMDEKAQRFDALLRTFSEQYKTLLANHEDEMLALSFAAICRVLGEHAVSVEGVRRHLRQAIAAYRVRSPFTIRMHPEDLALLQQRLSGDEIKGLEGAAEVQWVADPEVKLGGCMLHSSEGNLDARLETQIQALREILVGARAETKRESSNLGGDAA